MGHRGVKLCAGVLGRGEGCGRRGHDMVLGSVGGEGCVSEGVRVGVEVERWAK